MNTTEKISDLLKFDSLSEAEKITGTSYKENESVVGLGMLLQMGKSEKLNLLLNATDDTLFSNTVDEYIRKIESIGFQQVYYEPFVYTPDYGEQKPQNERMFTFFQYELGILLHFDTFGFDRVNSGNFYYNWSPIGIYDTEKCTRSGHYLFDKENDHVSVLSPDFKEKIILQLPPKPKWENQPWSEFRATCEPIENERKAIIEKSIFEDGNRTLWIGDHDCREAVKNNILRMQNYGKFCPFWKECAFPWLTNYAEHKGDYNLERHYETTKERLKKFPKDVLAQIGSYKQDIPQ
jgi:hypothetical protein